MKKKRKTWLLSGFRGQTNTNDKNTCLQKENKFGEGIALCWNLVE
jgi:hypothetical protein